MNKDTYPVYALAAVTALGIFVWSGVPATFLLVLVCPVMMFFMMRGMSGNKNSKSDDEEVSKRSDASKSDGSHERIT